MLRLDVVAMPWALARVASILARRRFEVLTMDVAAPVGGLRRITIEVDTADEIRLGQLVKFLNRSLDVVTVVRLSDDKRHHRQYASPLVANMTYLPVQEGRPTAGEPPPGDGTHGHGVAVVDTETGAGQTCTQATGRTS